LDPDQILQTAQQFVEHQLYDRALGEYAKLLRENPGDTRVLLRVGDVQARAGNFKGAIQTYAAAGSHYTKQNAALKAIAVYNQVRELIHQHEPGLIDEYAHLTDRLANLYVELDLVNDALRTLDEEATRLRNAEREEDAVALYHKMTDVGPSIPLPHLRLAEGLYRVGKVDDALKSFYSATRLLLHGEQVEDALRVLERMLHIKPDPKHAKLAARLYLERGTEAEGMQALSRLQICFQADPTDLETLHMLSQAFELIGHQDRSLEVLKELAKLAHEQGDAKSFQYALAQLRERAPDDDQVLALLKLPPPDAGSSRASRPVSAPVSSGPGSASGLSIPPPKPGGRSIAPPKPATRPAPALQIVTSRPPPPSSRAPGASSGPPSVMPPAVIPQIELGPTSSAPPIPLRNPAAKANRSAPLPPPPTRAAVPPAPRPGAAPVPAHAATSIAPVTDRVTSPGDSLEGALGSLKDLDEVLENSRKAIADAQTFRSLSLYHKGIEVTQNALDYDPQSIELREMLRDLYTDVGDRDGAIDEMLTMADIYVEFERPDHSLAVIQNVLEEEPGHEAGLQMLQALLKQHPELAPAAESYLAASITRSAALGSAAPASGAPSSAARASSVPASAASSSAVPAAAVSSSGATYIPPPPPVASGSGKPSLAPPPPPRRSSLAPPGAAPKLSVEEALEEVEFFSSRGLLVEARRLLEAQLVTYPEHPLLLDNLGEVEQLMADSQAAPDVSARLGGPARPGDSLDHDLQLSLHELETVVRASQRPPAFGKALPDIDIDSLFDKFKTAVKEQVSDSDAATHYDLALAYKEMSLLDDAIEELELAGRDPAFECVCFATIGLIYAEQGIWEKASRAFSRGLSATKKTPELESALYYDLAHASEMLGQLDQGIYYFRQVLRRDQNFRDTRARVEQLRTRRLNTPSGRPRAPDEEVDRAFEDLLGD
jgi:tetratricopeptide (TPR) repeat protein